MTPPAATEAVSRPNRWKRLLAWDSADSAAGASWPQRRLKGLLVRLQPHQYVRYQPVVRHVAGHRAQDPGATVLEVGSGTLGVTRFWRHPVTGVDLRFEGPCLGYLAQVQGSALELPFEDRSFTTSISVDVLEHIPHEQRPRALREMLRVSAGDVLVGVPCGRTARETDEWGVGRCAEALADPRNAARRAEIVKRSAFLMEHREAGYPTRFDMRRAIEEALAELGRFAEVTEFGNESVSAWRFTFPAVVPVARARKPIILALGLVFLPWLLRSRRGGYYRRYFLVRFTEPGAEGARP